MSNKYSDMTLRLPLTNKIRAALLPRPYIKGLDINRNQVGEIVSPQAIRDAGYEFIILEACWGKSVSPIFKEWPRLLDAGFIMLAYQFFDGRQNGAEMADLFMDTTLPMFEAQGFFMPYGFDVENFNGNTTTLTQRLTSFRQWRERISQSYIALPYSNQPSWQTQLGNEPLPSTWYGWAAHWDPTTEPLIPVGWKREQVLFHQIGVSPTFSWCPQVPGMSGDVGVDRFYGTREQLRGLGRTILPPPPPPPTAEPTHQDLMTQILFVRQDLAKPPQPQDIMAKLEQVIELLPIEPQPQPPTPVTYIQVRVSTADGNTKAVAHTYKQTNANGFPIWIIADDLDGGRLVFKDLDELIDVLPGLHKGDGGSYAYKLAPKYELPGRGDEPPNGLFLLDRDVRTA